jgi:hypothetical protein
MDYKPPKPIDESFTIAQVKRLKNFSNLVAGIAGGIAFLDQIGVGALLPARIQKYVTPGVAVIALTAFYTGNKKVGAALYADHANRPYNYTPDGAPGRNKKDALYQVFMTGAEVLLAEKATTGQLVPLNTAQKQEQFEEKILGKLDQFKPQTFSADNEPKGVALAPVEMGTVSHFAPNPIPTLSNGRKLSLSDLAAIAQPSTYAVIPDEVI